MYLAICLTLYLPQTLLCAIRLDSPTIADAVSLLFGRISSRNCAPSPSLAFAQFQVFIQYRAISSSHGSASIVFADSVSVWKCFRICRKVGAAFCGKMRARRSMEYSHIYTLVQAGNIIPSFARVQSKNRGGHEHALNSEVCADVSVLNRHRSAVRCQ